MLALVRNAGRHLDIDYSESVASLFWRVGTHFNAWVLPSLTGTLFKALSLSLQSIIDAAPKRLTFPIVHVSTLRTCKIVYLRGVRSFLRGYRGCHGTVPFSANDEHSIIMCMGTPPHEGEDLETHIHGTISIMDSQQVHVTLFPPYLAHDYRHKDHPFVLPRRSLQVRAK